MFAVSHGVVCQPKLFVRCSAVVDSPRFSLVVVVIAGGWFVGGFALFVFLVVGVVCSCRSAAVFSFSFLCFR